jgi:hypothetical protein
MALGQLATDDFPTFQLSKSKKSFRFEIPVSKKPSKNLNFLELLHNSGATHVKFFSGNDPSRGKKHTGNLNLTFLKRKTLSLFRESLVLKRKVAKMRFLPKNPDYNAFT